jgi:hypothetical protein
MTFKLTTSQGGTATFGSLAPGAAYRVVPGGSIYMKLGTGTVYTTCCGTYRANAVVLDSFNLTDHADGRYVYPTAIEAREVTP